MGHLAPSPKTVCTYIEPLAQTLKSTKSVVNYVSAIRLFYKAVALEAPALDKKTS